MQTFEELSQIAVDEPQLAYAAFTGGICHQWTFYERKILDIRENFVPNIGKKISDATMMSINGMDGRSKPSVAVQKKEQCFRTDLKTMTHLVLRSSSKPSPEDKII